MASEPGGEGGSALARQQTGDGGAFAAPAELLRIEALEAGYGEVTVLWGVDLVIREGAITALIGSNGAGKSTLMRTISALVPVRAGRIFWQGSEIHGTDPGAMLGRGIVHVPEGRRLFSAMSVEDNLIMGAYLRRIGRRVMQSELDRIYTIFPRLGERRHQPAGTLSGGEQQMCAIGRGLMGAPKLLMIDELSLGLSPLLVEQLLEALAALHRDGLTIFVVEQDVVTALEISQTAYVMDTGRIVQQGASRDLLHDPAIREAYMGALAG